MEWWEENLLRLIDIYRGKPMLWDPRHKDHFKKNLKADAWNQISAEMEMPADTCRKKIASLLSSYRREKYKIKNSLSTGSGRDEIYISRWFAYEAFKFLEDRDMPRKRLATETNNEMEECEESHHSSPAPTTAQRSTKRARFTDENTSKMHAAFTILSEAAKKMDNAPTPNEIDSFFTYIAAKVNKYPAEVQNIVQHEIFEIVKNADRGFYNWSSPQSNPNWQNHQERTPSQPPQLLSLHQPQYAHQVHTPFPSPSSTSLPSASNQPSPASAITEDFSDFL